MTCRRLNTPQNDGNVKTPRKRALGTLFLTLALVLGVVVMVSSSVVS